MATAKSRNLRSNWIDDLDLDSISVSDIINNTSKTNPSPAKTSQKRPKHLMTEEEREKWYNWTNMIFDEVSTDEALKSVSNELAQPQSSYPIVNAISKLQEILILSKISPVYTELETLDISNPFSMRVSYKSLNGVVKSAIGTGRSKKEAKLKAAEELLNSISKRDPNEKVINNNSFFVDNVSLTPVKSVNLRPTPTISSINMLQEFLVKRAWPLPEYEELSSEGPDHNRIFSASCKVQNLKVIGQGNTKKLAKHTAAEKMLSHLSKYHPY